MKFYFIILAILLVIILIGCSIFGGAESNPETKTNAELETELETVKKEIDESKKEYANKGDVTAFEQRISNIENKVININSQITKIQSTSIQNNESITKIIWTLAAIYFIWTIIKIIKAKILPGSTIKNIFTKSF